MSILILFQSFKVVDEIFNNKKDQKKGYIILDQDDDDEVSVAENKSNEKEEKIDFESLFSKASLDGGEKIAKQCVACHSVDNSLKVKVGPPLWGIINRNAASINDFKYSDALINFKKAWSREELFHFLEKPKDYIKGTKMIYKGLKKPSDRADLISYLESLK
tara:strand:- start:1117 stop:1602 length:486 start_codon:yes stop_codon:yes gene_type:complete